MFVISVLVLVGTGLTVNSAPHVLQWMVGCEGETQPNGALRFVRGMSKYNYDGNDFLSFDDKSRVWVAPVKEALPSKTKWDNDQVLKEYTKGYLENECIDWLSKSVTSEQKQLKKAPPPDVYVFAKKSRVETNLTLTCLATGFYSKNVILRIRRNGRVLTEDDGLSSSGVLPNNNETFQRRDHVEILKSDLSKFSCEVVHEATRVDVVKTWKNGDHPDEPGSGALTGAQGGALAAIALVVGGGLGLICLHKKGRLRGRRVASDNQGSVAVVVTNVEADSEKVEEDEGNEDEAEETSLRSSTADGSDKKPRLRIHTKSSATENMD